MLRIIASVFVLNFILLGYSLATDSTENFPPQPAPPKTTVDPSTTHVPEPNVTTTVVPPNSTTTIKPSPPTTTKPIPPTSTVPPNSTTTTKPPPTTPTTTTETPQPAPNVTTTTPLPPTTLAPNVTTQLPTTTVKPIPPPADRKFDAFSFLGGFSLALGLVAIAFLSWKFYMSRQENLYHTL